MDVVILAAGKGTRMRSRLPKVLQPLAGRPLLAHVLDTARRLNPRRLLVVVGHEAERVREAFASQSDLVWVEQRPQLGTGHALRVALHSLGREDVVLVLYGDVPLLRPETLARLLEAAEGGRALALLTARLPDPGGYGRIVRDASGRICAIVEEKDADARVRSIDEINTGVMALPAARLPAWLESLTNANAQGEYYLTDVVAAAVRDGVPVIGVEAEEAAEVLGVNDKAQLATLERLYQQREAERLLRAGVTLLDPARLEVRGTLECGMDVTIDVGCVFSGRVVLGDGVRVGPYCVLSDCTVAEGAEIRAFSHLEGAEIGPQAVVGPYARLRPGTRLARGVHVGNFVEVKNSSFGPETKANHLAYLGDAEIGARVNIGAGTITCNYDGANKHRTVIEDDAFIGSDTQLVAPVRVGRGATLGAGTTLTRDAPPEALTVSRAPQRTLSGWQRPTKKKE
ncbi:bifunctional UDP-N-acetylglucosamine diphosphorylase/glucosamine-1-phosphate N-acetyltransferase GlmU [Tepidiphilus margaritifer]|uniref:bifunctional UDP-N-acetylglucosamine diphosphorylase/glucosamine-1-phosphate N-acetyltransferase GlmU n=1 Tax=Tepidiphilus margaritifer TaxID=203471 RepID=UPI0003FF4411|nr:bifunctional UDP-N-acetylglucosamine diphosphorylase/glucosamine-1-phosphate N-acetyltransferase GlmU [Tepidiphilus margaritifer]